MSNSDDIFISEYVLCEKEHLEQVGFRFFETLKLPNGKEAVRAKLPDGWSKKRIDVYQINIFDSLGRHRASYADNLDDPQDINIGKVFLKPRFYTFYEQDDQGNMRETAKKNLHTETDNIILYVTPWVNLKELKYPETVHRTRELYNESEGWLDQHYPNWRDPTKYWDLD